MPTDIAKYSIELFKPVAKGPASRRSSIGTPTSRPPDRYTEPVSSSIPVG